MCEERACLGNIQMRGNTADFPLPLALLVRSRKDAIIITAAANFLLWCRGGFLYFGHNYLHISLFVTSNSIVSIGLLTSTKACNHGALLG